MVALVPVPLVAADATVVAPFLMATVNWSALLMRPTTDLISVSVGAGALVIEQLITSPASGVIEKGAADPVGSTVAEPLAVFEQLMVPAYWPMVLALPPAIASVRE